MPRASDQDRIIVYVDGACTGNPGSGGYAALVLDGPCQQRITGGYRLTTNNRMELMAVIAGLSTLGARSATTVRCDSLYVVKAMTKGWARRWKANGWRLTRNTRALNSDLWERLLELDDRHDLRFEWVPGHADDERNNLCDGWAQAAAGGVDLPADVAYEAELARVPSDLRRFANRTG